MVVISIKKWWYVDHALTPHPPPAAAVIVVIVLVLFRVFVLVAIVSADVAITVVVCQINLLCVWLASSNFQILLCLFILFVDVFNKDDIKARTKDLYGYYNYKHRLKKETLRLGYFPITQKSK